MAARPDIAVISPYGTLNFGANLGYTMGGKETVINGAVVLHTQENSICVAAHQAGGVPYKSSDLKVE